MKKKIQKKTHFKKKISVKPKVFKKIEKKVEKKKEIPPKPYQLKDLDKPAEISSYFGFMAVKTPEITKDDISKTKSFKEPTTGAHQENTSAPDFHLLLEEKIALLRMYFAENMNALPQPVLLYYKKPFAGIPTKKTREHQYGLEILGTSKSVAEATIIKTAFAILEEEGFTNMCVDINSVGDKESMARFERELALYLKKNSNDIPAVCKTLFKKDIYEILKSEEEKCVPLKENAPKAISCLSELSRQHFKEVLEFLETLEIPYRINNTLLGSKNYCSQTIFEIKTEKGELLAVGMRYNSLAKKIGAKKEVPAIGVSFCYKKPVGTNKKISLKNLPKPKFYLVQLGFEAKLKSLNIIDEMRKARSPICHSLTKDMCMSQIGVAENMKIPYMVIIGQKEAMENTVIVRNSNTRAQDTVHIKNLAGHAKKLK